MKYAILGGDERMSYLAEFISSDNDVSDCTHAMSDISDCDCVILPLPTEKNGRLNAPFWTNPMSMTELVALLPENALVFAGKLSAETKEAAEKHGINIIDYMSRPEFTVGNAEITAEGAVNILMNAVAYALCRAKVLVVGYGRIGKILSRRISSLGADVSVMSKNAESRAMAKAMGYGAITPEQCVKDFDIVVNTAPAKVLKNLEGLRQDCVLLELASAPGGIDAQVAEKLRLRYIAAPGLPGKYAPQSAGKCIKDAVESILKERSYFE